MQQHMGQLDEEMRKVEDQLYSAERERDKAVEEVRAMKKMVHNSNQEINKRDRDIESLKLEVEKARGLELKLGEKDATIEKLRSDLAEMERGKECGRKIMKKLEEAEKEIECLARKKSEVERGCRVEMEWLRKEVKLASVAEETSKKALDELALALKEVGREASEAKEELGVAKAELQHSKGEEERLKLILKSNEDKFRRQLEETQLAWNDKETGLVECLRIANEERAENFRLIELSKEENGRLRDILKQALRESTAAKEAAEIARAENSRLLASLPKENESTSTSACWSDKDESVVENAASTASTSILACDDDDDDDVLAAENDRSSSSLGIKNKRKIALLKRFGDLLLVRKRNITTTPSD